MTLLNQALTSSVEARKEKTAVIVKGNKKYLDKNKTIADLFYATIEEILVRKGYTVSFDDGLEMTKPKTADVWVAHSKGIDRLRFAKEHTKAIPLETLVDEGNHSGHYVLSEKDFKALDSL